MSALATIVALTAAPAHGQRAELEKIIKRRVLANGLEVIVVENHGVPLATVEVDVKNGSFTQAPEYAGLAHMYEHMFFKANEHLPEPDQFIDRAAELGAVFNGRTDEERVAYYMTLPADSRSEEHTSELQSQSNLVCRLLLEKKKKKKSTII